MGYNAVKSITVNGCNAARGMTMHSVSQYKENGNEWCHTVRSMTMHGCLSVRNMIMNECKTERLMTKLITAAQ